MTARYSFHLMAVCALALGLMASAHAQDRQPGEVSVVEVAPASDRGTYTLRHFDPSGTGAVITTAQGGYVFGTNGYGDLAKAVAFELPAGMSQAQVVEVNAYMFRSSFPTLAEYEVAVYAGNSTSGPTSVIYTELFEIEHITNVGSSGPFDRVDHPLDDAPTVDGPQFFVGFQWDEGHDDDDLGMVSTTGLASPSPWEWEMWDTGTWFNVASAWGSNGWHVWIEAVVQDAISTEPGAEPRRFTLSSVYPNPVAGQSHVQLDLEAAQHVSVEVFNLLGQRVATVFDGTAQAGRSILDVNGSNLSAGVYMLRITGDDFAQTRKFVVAQ